MVRATLLVALGATPACSGSTATTASPPAYDLGGSWTGSFVSQTGARGSATASFSQTGSAVDGAFVSENACIGGGKFAGSLSGDALNGSLTAGAVRVALSATVVSAKQIDGTYSLGAAGGCPNDDGSFHLAR